MIKVILFDLWGTLVENGVWSPTKQVKNILGINIPFSEYIVRMEKAMMTAPFPALKDAFEQLCKEFEINCTKKQMEILIGMWNKSWMLAYPYKETEVVLKSLKQKYKLGLVSNTDCFSTKRVLEKFHLEEYFDELFLSYEMGMIKTDKEFFNVVLDKLKITPKDCVMVGDSLQSDIMAAQQLGITGILVDRKDTREFNVKIKSLEELEELLEKI